MINLDFGKILAEANDNATKYLAPHFWPMVGQIINETWFMLLIIVVIMILDGKSKKLGRGMANIGAFLLCVAVFGVRFIFSDWRDVVVCVVSAAIIGGAGLLWSQRWRIVQW
jgi:hypothetical protein